ncbi:DUF4369 domain-containing protein [Muribaculaceae bacterium Isolate-104 (HZI)]|nr:DUF4369 domain-containing protein [Muribaculaceae bacterium Isolate-104 (HZI)]
MVMKLFKANILTACAASAFIFSGCGNGNEWKVSGEIEGADGQTMVLEASSNGRWFPIDSVKLSGAGSFRFSHEAAGYPDIYRLRLGDKSLYFPIDSIESVTVVSKASAFDSEYTLTGSESAEMLMHVDKRVREAISRNGLASLPNDTLLKRELGGMMLGDPAGIVAYYIINKRVGGVALYNPENKSDNKIIGAVANAFDQYRPNDPRTEFLKRLFITNRRNSSGKVSTIEAPEVSLFEIELYDNTGKLRKLSEVAADNKVVLLSFTVYGAEPSPAYNVELNKVYDRYSKNGLEIYQVGLDEDEYRWKQSARNLPWITVYNSASDGVKNLDNYNVVSLPTTYVIVNGEIAGRVLDPAQVGQEVGKYM